MRFLNKEGLSELLNLLKNIFATKKSVINCNEMTHPFMLDIDYSLLEFDTDLIISNGSSSTINVGQVGYMIIAKS